MKADLSHTFERLEAFVCHNDEKRQLLIPDINNNQELNLGPEQDGLTQLYVKNEENNVIYYAKIILEIGHHHHQKLKPLGLPLEIIPVEYGHFHAGSEYGVIVLKNGRPLSNVNIGVTYTNISYSDYPHILTTGDDGKATVFLTEPGNYLFVTESEEIVSTFTLVKNF
ncbi:MAG: DUF4198 domain-containing protein [Syntrophomonadaceae bacterium]|nr:DUF4198 domain-containing protein [Syntrophomonadaceae bacterium]